MFKKPFDTKPCFQIEDSSHGEEEFEDFCHDDAGRLKEHLPCAGGGVTHNEDKDGIL